MTVNVGKAATQLPHNPLIDSKEEAVARAWLGGTNLAMTDNRTNVHTKRAAKRWSERCKFITLWRSSKIESPGHTSQKNNGDQHRNAQRNKL
mmetsp:Transcript_36740/g.61974  ORF Transcript_36740/g.61974 Transcript_36740/m.61974 type:complete len:92 (+) Transcript_36740:116-391(+)